MAHKILILSRKFREGNREYVDEFLDRRNCVAMDPQLNYPVSQDQLVDVVGEAEGIITGLTVSSVLAMRPDLVFGARDLMPAIRSGGGTRTATVAR